MLNNRLSLRYLRTAYLASASTRSLTERNRIRKEVSGRGLTYRPSSAASLRCVPRPAFDKLPASATTSAHCFARVRPYTFQETSNLVTEIGRLPRSDSVSLTPNMSAETATETESRLFTDTDTGILHRFYEVQYAFKISMTHLIMQFALRIAVRSVLHRWLSLDIHC